MSKRKFVTVTYSLVQTSTIYLDDLSKEERDYIHAFLKDDSERSMKDWKILDKYDWRDILARVLKVYKYDVEMEGVENSNF
jgi:hypothetical protein